MKNRNNNRSGGNGNRGGNFPQQTHFIGVLLPEDITLTLEDCRNMRNKDQRPGFFIVKLAVLTQAVINNIDELDYQKEAKSLKELFDSFAIVDEFTDSRIIDCYNRIKISLMKWERFADKSLPVAIDFKKLLDHFYEVMKDLYFSEIFGFFSTTVHPEDVPELNLPCKVFCGCNEGWAGRP